MFYSFLLIQRVRRHVTIRGYITLYVIIRIFTH